MNIAPGPYERVEHDGHMHTGPEHAYKKSSYEQLVQANHGRVVRHANALPALQLRQLAAVVVGAVVVGASGVRGGGRVRAV